MSEEGNKKLQKHYTELTEGKIKTGNPVRDDLIVSDAKKHLADLVKKNPGLVQVEGSVKEDKPEKTKKISKEE